MLQLALSSAGARPTLSPGFRKNLLRNAGLSNAAVALGLRLPWSEASAGDAAHSPASCVIHMGTLYDDGKSLAANVTGPASDDAGRGSISDRCNEMKRLLVTGIAQAN